MTFWSALRWHDRLLLIGAAGVIVGAAAVLIAGGRNRNDVQGASAVLIGLGLVAATGWLLTRRGGGRVATASAVVLAVAAASLVLSGLELLESVRAGFATDRLGLLGLMGRVLGFAASLVLVFGARTNGIPPMLVRGLPRLLAILGAASAVGGWAMLIVVGEGFALRTIDAAGIAACVCIGVLSVLATSGRLVLVLGIGLAALVALVAADVVVILSPSIGDVLDSGPATSGPVVVYLAGAVAVVVSLVLRVRAEGSWRTAPPTTSDASVPEPQS